MFRRQGLLVCVLAIVSVAGLGCAESSEPAKATESASGQGREFVRDPEVILDTTWEWVSTTTPIEETVVPEPDRYTILLQPDGRLVARFDCNRGGGDYSIDEGKLSFGPMISTRMACGPDSLDTPFMRDLERITSFFVQDGELFLEMPYDSGTMRFRKA